MRLPTLLAIAITVLTSGASFAQVGPIDFETGGAGAAWTWNVFENGANAPLEFVPNPDATGLSINTSATVAKITALQAGAPWVGTETAHGSPLGTFNLTAANSTVKIMVYKSIISDVGIKFAKPDGWALPEQKVANTQINQWEELTFDFSSKLADGYDQIIVFPDFDLVGRTGDNVVYFDNITFSAAGGGGGGSVPTAAAPTPTHDAAEVASLFSNAYTNSAVDTWSAGWDQADVADAQVAGNDVKLYTNLTFAGIEFTTATVDASSMTHFHMDFWTPDATAAPAVFKIKLVDFGDNGVWNGGGDDVEHQITLDAASTPALATGEWVSIDLALSDFTGLTTRAHVAQMVIEGDPNTVYIDNVYFYGGTGGGGGSVPTAAAPTPTQDAADVTSLFSNAYTNVAVDTWSAGWDVADVADAQVAGDDVKLYTNLGYAGIEFTTATVDATARTHFHMDFWTPDPTAAPAVFKIKLVDFGANGVWNGGGDDVEHEVTLDATTTPAIATGIWASLDLPLSDFAGMTTRAHVAQLIISGDPNTVYIDNVYFYGNTGVGVEDASAEIPAAYALDQNYPNPFNPTTSIRVSLPEASQVTLRVYNVLGQVVATLVNGFQPAGTMDVSFDASNLPTGTYLYAISAGGYSATKKMVLVR